MVDEIQVVELRRDAEETQEVSVVVESSAGIVVVLSDMLVEPDVETMVWYCVSVGVDEHVDIVGLSSRTTCKAQPNITAAVRKQLLGTPRSGRTPKVNMITIILKYSNAIATI